MAAKAGIQMHSFEQVLGVNVYRAGRAEPLEGKERNTIENQYLWKYSDPDRPVVISQREHEYIVTFQNGASEKLDQIFMDNRWSLMEFEDDPLECPRVCGLCSRLINFFTPSKSL